MKRKYKMYGLVPSNISDKQKGIQFGHAVVEYIQKYMLSSEPVAQALGKWMSEDKTFIILDGGTTNNSSGPYLESEDRYPLKGTLNNHRYWLGNKGIPFADFYETDLGDQLSAVVFLVDDRVWDKEKYPPFKQWMIQKKGLGKYMKWKKDQFEVEKTGEYEVWEEFIGGKTQVKLREWLSQFKLA